jgi:hypothetical protein
MDLSKLTSEELVKDFYHEAFVLGKGHYAPTCDSFYNEIIRRLKDAEKYQQLWDAADEVIIANGCGSSELFDRAIGKLRAALAPWKEAKHE